MERPYFSYMSNKGSATAIIIIIASFLALGSYLTFKDENIKTMEPTLGAPYFQQFRDIIPDVDSTRYIGTSSPSTIAWASGIFDELCLTADSCKTAWPASGGSGAFPFSATTNFGQVVYATNTPTLWFQGGMFASSTSWFTHATTTSFNARFASSTYASTTALSVSGTASSTSLVVSGLNAANCDVKSSTSGIFSCGTDATGGGSGTVSTSTNEVAGTLAYWTSNSATPALLGQIATTTLTGTSPLSLSNPVAKVGGSNSVLSWDFSVANIWTGLQRFNSAASSTQFSATRAYFGGTATTTITNTGFIGIASSSPTYALTIEGGSATTPFVAVGSVDNFIQGVVWNKNSGTTASADWTASNNLSCPEPTCGYYVDLGINSSNYSNATYSASGANDSYLYANDDNLVIGTASTTDLTASLIFTSGGFTTSHERMRLTRGGLFGFGTTTPNLSFLTIASSTAPQLSLSAGAGIPQWTFRNAGGNLYLSTTTLAGTATSTPAALTLQPGSTALGIASTTFSGMLGLGPSTSNGSSTVAAGKFQVDGYTSNGVRYCAFFNNAGVWATSTGACNQ